MTQHARILNLAMLGTVEYQATLALQRAMVAARQTDAIPDTLLLLEHPHVFTLGRGADESFLLAAASAAMFQFIASRAAAR